MAAPVVDAGAALLLETCSLTILLGTEAAATLTLAQREHATHGCGSRQHHSQAIIFSLSLSSELRPTSRFPPRLDSESLSFLPSCISAGLPLGVAPAVRADGAVRDESPRPGGAVLSPLMRVSLAFESNRSGSAHGSTVEFTRQASETGGQGPCGRIWRQGPHQRRA